MSKSGHHWKCAHNCGACCRLAPTERVEALSVLDSTQTKKYLEMVGMDGWCIYYDKGKRECSIYEVRPDFCHVKALSKLFDVPKKEENLFAIKCCREQIRSVYGGRSPEMKRFNRVIRSAKQSND